MADKLTRLRQRIEHYKSEKDFIESLIQPIEQIVSSISVKQGFIGKYNSIKTFEIKDNSVYITAYYDDWDYTKGEKDFEISFDTIAKYAEDNNIIL